MHELLERIAGRVDRTLENASTAANVSCAVGGTALLAAGTALVATNEALGLGVETVGFVGFASGVLPPILRWIGLAPPRQNHQSEVQ
jgi:tetrahydromethanopterin S-methyltransferase subunit F